MRALAARLGSRGVVGDVRPITGARSSYTEFYAVYSQRGGEYST